MPLKETAESYYNSLSSLLGKIQVTEKGGISMNFFAAIEVVGQLSMAQASDGKKIILILSV